MNDDNIRWPTIKSFFSLLIPFTSDHLLMLQIQIVKLDSEPVDNQYMAFDCGHSIAIWLLRFLCTELSSKFHFTLHFKFVVLLLLTNHISRRKLQHLIECSRARVGSDFHSEKVLRVEIKLRENKRWDRELSSQRNEDWKLCNSATVYMTVHALIALFSLNFIQDIITKRSTLFWLEIRLYVALVLR